MFHEIKETKILPDQIDFVFVTQDGRLLKLMRDVVNTLLESENILLMIDILMSCGHLTEFFEYV